MSKFLGIMIASASSGRGSFTYSTGMGAVEPEDLHRDTWAQIHADACIAARALTQSGIGPGSPVALLVGEPREVAVIAQAVWLCGGSVTMLHQPTARTDLASYANDTAEVLNVITAQAVVLGTPFSALADQFDQIKTNSPLRPFTVDELLAEGSEEVSWIPDPEVVGEEATALLQLTSGSTSAPKAVRITHHNLITNMRAMQARGEIGDHDVMISWLPLFHDMGMVGFLTVPMTFGVHVVKVTPAAFLARPMLWMELIDHFGGTITAAPNFAYAVAARALKRADPLDLSTMRFALNGAEPIDVDVVAAFTKAGERHKLPQTSVVCAYGMAEAALAVSFAPLRVGVQVDVIDAEQLERGRRAGPADPDTGVKVRRFPLLGPPLDDIEVRVVDDGGQPLAERSVGVIELRGASVTSEYLTVDGPRATIGANGWFDTGDEGYLAGGQVVVCGRRKDLIILAGRNIYPTDIERAAERVEGVRAGNTVAVRLDTRGQRETFAVAVESRQAGDAHEEARISHEVTSRVVTELGARPAIVAVMAPGKLPKTPSGKLRRSSARELLTAMVADRSAEPDAR